jgi:hypothetical protein
MPAIDPIAVRVARRHAAVVGDVPATARIEHIDAGRITAAELAEMLKTVVGPLSRMRFHRPPGSTNTIGWAAVDPNGGGASGSIELHATVTDNAVITSASVTIDPPGTSVVADPRELRLIVPAAARLARAYQRRPEGLVEVSGEDDEEGGKLERGTDSFAITAPARSCHPSAARDAPW